MTAREAILRDIRHNLGRGASLVAPVPPAARLNVPKVSISDRIELMLDRVIALAGRAVRVKSGADAVEYVAGVTGGADRLLPIRNFCARRGSRRCRALRVVLLTPNSFAGFARRRILALPAPIMPRRYRQSGDVCQSG